MRTSEEQGRGDVLEIKPERLPEMVWTCQEDGQCTEEGRRTPERGAEEMYGYNRGNVVS